MPLILPVGAEQRIKHAQGKDRFTKALLHFNGANGSRTIVDECGHSITCPTNVCLTTTSPKFGSACLTDDATYANNNGVYWTEDYSLGSLPFCIDFWIKFKANPAYYSSVFQNNWIMLKHGGNSGYDQGMAVQLRFVDDTYIEFYDPSTTNPGNNVWCHYAVTRVGNSYKLYKAGSLVASGTSSKTLKGAGTGMIGWSNASTVMFYSSMDEFRLTIGTPRWTGAFAPPIRSYY